MNKYILAIALLCFMVLGFTPVALAGQYQWQLTTDQQGNIHETLIIQDVETALNTEGWSSSSGEGTLTLERVHADWLQYSAARNGLPIKAEIKSYIIFSTTTLSYDNQGQASLFNELESMADGYISIQGGGIIRQSSASEETSLDQDPTAIWHLTSEQGKDVLEQAPVFLQMINFDGLAVSLTILLLGFIGITTWYLIHIRRVHKLIVEEYSLNNIERLLEKDEEEKENE